jgi:hypothetical protein
MNYADLIILFFGIGYSFLLVVCIDQGLQPKQQLLLLLIPVMAAIIYWQWIKKSAFENLNWGFISLPLFIVLLYYVLNLISWKVNNREFRLRIRGSRNIYKGNTNWLDIAFSFLLVFSFFVWPFTIAILLKKING